MLKSLRRVARELHIDRYWLKGFCDGRRLPLVRRGRVLGLAPESVEKVKQHLAEQTKAEAA